jgi:hypothetical protein
MKTILTTFALACALAAPAFATTHKEAPGMGASAPMGKQQTKMAECNKQAGDKKGDERQAFMKTCLSAKKVSQQDKMKACNKDAGEMKGDERKAFMKKCLSA